MRNSGRCPKCGWHEIVALPRLVDYQESAIAAHVRVDEWSSSGELKVAGKMRALICRSCGFTELYAVDPQKIPVDEIEGAFIVTPQEKDPYRG